MRTACFSDSGWEVSVQGVSVGRPPGQRPISIETLIDRDPLEGTWPGTEVSLEGTSDQTARQKVASYRDPHGQNDRQV